MKKVLGLHIGINSIGWALIETNAYEEAETATGRIRQMGSRILPMSGDELQRFATGNLVSKEATRNEARNERKQHQRYKLRRTRLIRACKIMGWMTGDAVEQLPFSEETKKEAAACFKTEGKIPAGWLIWYLKSKALHEQVTLPELARILYHYNQRRGYKGSRKDNQLPADTGDMPFPHYEKWVDNITITAITEKEKKSGNTWYELSCKTNELKFKAVKRSRKPLNLLNKTIEAEITKKTTKDLSVSYTITEIDPAAWRSRKAALEKDIQQQRAYLSEYFLEKIRTDRHYRIKQRIIDRRFYQEELEKIWETQAQFYQQEFDDAEKRITIADSFYPHNKEKNRELRTKKLFHLFSNDIIYYQRPHSSQKHTIPSCEYETKTYRTKDGTQKTVNVKATAKSAPCFQEFRIWQTINNLRVFRKVTITNGEPHTNIDVTSQYLTVENKQRLFEWFDNAAEVSHDKILRLLGFSKNVLVDGEKTFDHYLNCPAGKVFTGNETRSLFRRIFRKHNFTTEGGEYLADKKSFHHLWHIVYSLPDEKDILSALQNNHFFSFPAAVRLHIAKLPPFKTEYALLSSKAINKLLPFLREGLSTNEAVAAVYGKAMTKEKYQNIEELKIHELLPPGSLPEPVTEKILRETLSLIKDIWKDEGLGRPDHIHVYLDPLISSSKAARKKITEANRARQVDNLPHDINEIKTNGNNNKFINRKLLRLVQPIPSATSDGVMFVAPNIIPMLKTTWGLQRLWKDLLLPRFEQLEDQLEEKLIVYNNEKEHDYHFTKSCKGIDHRQHALDALVIACHQSNNHPWKNFLNEAKSALEAVIVSHKQPAKLISQTINRYHKWEETSPGQWEKNKLLQQPPKQGDKYWVAARRELPSSPYASVTQPEYKQKVDWKKALKMQMQFNKREEGEWNTDDWRIARKELRKEINQVLYALNNDEQEVFKHFTEQQLKTSSGADITRLDLLRFVQYAARRRPLDAKLKADMILKMPGAAAENKTLVNLLTAHLKEHGGSSETAFTGEGLEQMQAKLSHRMDHIRVIEGPVDHNAGTTPCFIVKVKKERDKRSGLIEEVRKYSTPSLLECVEKLAKGLPVHEQEPGSEYLVLSPGDIVYVPKYGERPEQINWSDKRAIAERVYLMKYCKETSCFFLPAYVAGPIMPYDSKTKKGEFGATNRSEKTVDRLVIKENFIRLNVDRLGNFVPLL